MNATDEGGNLIEPTIGDLFIRTYPDDSTFAGEVKEVDGTAIRVKGAGTVGGEFMHNWTGWFSDLSQITITSRSAP